MKQEFLTEASTDLNFLLFAPPKKKKKKKREKTAQNCSVMHEKKRAKNDDAFRCSREVL